MNLNKPEQYIGILISILAILLFFSYFFLATLKIENKTLAFILFSVSSIISIGSYIVFLVRLRKSNKLVEIDYINIGIQRYVLGMFMIIYGVPKLFGAFFDYQLFALDQKLVNVSEFELAWYYYGKNNWQELVSGILEFVPALFLFNRKTYYVASIILLFITSQVFILNSFFKIGAITFLASTILLACNIYILYSQKKRIIEFFKSLHFSKRLNFSNTQGKAIKVLKRVGISLALLLIVIKTKPHIFKSDYQKKYENLVGKYSIERVVKNNGHITPNNNSNIYKDLYIEKQHRWNILRDFKNNTSAFILKLNESNDSISIYINKGGIGDSPDIIDSTSVLKGIYTLTNNTLLIKGIQQKDTLELTYSKQNLEPKKWLW